LAWALFIGEDNVYGRSRTEAMFTVCAPEAGKLEQVNAEMIQLGAPKIEVVDCGDYYMALEGSHRLAAAHALGIAPELVIHKQDDWFEPDMWAPWNGENTCSYQYEADEVAGELHSPRCEVYGYDS
jgi:hypothetical protein